MVLTYLHVRILKFPLKKEYVRDLWDRANRLTPNEGAFAAALATLWCFGGLAFALTSKWPAQLDIRQGVNCPKRVIQKLIWINHYNPLT